MSEKVDDLLVLFSLGAGAMAVGCGLVTAWMRIVRHTWPTRVLILITAVGLGSITALSVLTYLILEH